MRNHSTKVLSVRAVPSSGVAVGIGVSVNKASGVVVGVSVFVAVSIAAGVSVSVAVSLPADVPVANGVSESEGMVQPFGTCGWTTMPTAVCFPALRLAGAMPVTKEPTASESARPGGIIFNVVESIYSCWFPDWSMIVMLRPGSYAATIPTGSLV